MSHVFVVCAYKKSPYLERCIQSLMEQTVPAKIIVATSTPNEYIADICRKYKIHCYTGRQKSGLAADWNFAYGLGKADYVTLAHQDDLYEPDYIKKVTAALAKAKHPLIAFTDYFEYRKEQKVHNNRNLRIKRILLAPLQYPIFQKSRWIRRRILSFGNPICCPSVTYVRKNLPHTLFKGDFSSNTDWQAWEALSKLKGSFVYVKEPLMSHRIHSDSTTTAIIGERRRQREDVEMLKKFWPGFLAELIEKIYSKSEKSNDV